MNQPSILDVVGAAVFVLAYIFSREVASVVGPYIVIVAASAIGSSFALVRREKTTRLAAFGYFSRVAGLAIILTVIAATWISSYNESLTIRALIAPVAFMIGFVGDDLPVLAWTWLKNKFGGPNA